MWAKRYAARGVPGGVARDGSLMTGKCCMTLSLCLRKVFSIVKTPRLWRETMRAPLGVRTIGSLSSP